MLGAKLLTVKSGVLALTVLLAGCGLIIDRQDRRECKAPDTHCDREGQRSGERELNCRGMAHGNLAWHVTREFIVGLTVHSEK